MIQRKRVLVITGVPGTGKTSFSNLLAKKMGNVEVIHVTDVVNAEKLFTSRSRDGAKIVDMRRLQRELGLMISSSKKRTILLESHLLCDMKLRNAGVLVLREHLDALIGRMEKRGYSKEKIKANVVSEATDYCGIRAERNYKNVFEAFSGDKRLPGYATRLLEGKRLRKRSIDLLPEFDLLLRKRRELAL